VKWCILDLKGTPVIHERYFISVLSVICRVSYPHRLLQPGFPIPS
jgi:hypothetical protein